MEKVTSFSVLPLTELSDHCCTFTNIKINTPKPSSDTCDDSCDVTINPHMVKLTYDKNKKHTFQANILLTEKLNPLMKLLNKSELSKEDLNLGVTQLNEVIIDAAKMSFPSSKVPIGNRNKKKRKSKIWFNKECGKLRKILQKHSRNLSSSPFDRHKLHLYTKARAEYKHICRKAEKQNRKDLTDKLINMGTEHPQTFWSVINKMNNWDKGETENTEHIKPSTWATYFKKLLNKNEPDHYTHSNDLYPMNPNFTPTFDPSLDGVITAKEMREALEQMKDKKAPGPDGILGEYLKAFGEAFEGILLKIIRQLFSKHVYPPQWNSNYLKPIYKKGEVEDPDNYRGLAIGSSLAKLFSMILLKRLTIFIDQNNVISANQIGFMKGARTSDHIFLLQTVIEKVVKKKRGKLYAAFIDFKKAYDTVDRRKLFERLQTVGINGIYLQNIIAM